MFRGRLDIFNIINQPYGYVQTLKYIAEKRSKSMQYQAMQRGEVIEDAVTGNL